MRRRHQLCAWTCAGLLVIGLVIAAPGEAKKKRKISIADDPVLGESTTGLVLIEIGDFQ